MDLFTTLKEILSSDLMYETLVKMYRMNGFAGKSDQEILKVMLRSLDGSIEKNRAWTSAWTMMKNAVETIENHHASKYYDKSYASDESIVRRLSERSQKIRLLLEDRMSRHFFMNYLRKQLEERERSLFSEKPPKAEHEEEKKDPLEGEKPASTLKPEDKPVSGEEHEDKGKQKYEEGPACSCKHEKEPSMCHDDLQLHLESLGFATRRSPPLVPDWEDMPALETVRKTSLKRLAIETCRESVLLQAKARARSGYCYVMITQGSCWAEEIVKYVLDHTEATHASLRLERDSGGRSLLISWCDYLVPDKEGKPHPCAVLSGLLNSKAHTIERTWTSM